MTVLQSNAAPITTESSLQIVTLKNLIALDIVEQNEAVLSSFGLFDNSTKKIKIQEPLTKEQIQKRIDELKPSMDMSEQLKQYKAELHSSRDISSKQLLESLAAEFLTDDIANDNTDDLISQFERDNNVKVILDESQQNYYKVDGTSIKNKLQKTTSTEELESSSKESDDVEMN